MPLKDVIMEIADEMRKEAENLKGHGEAGIPVRVALEMYAGQLRIACKASNDVPPTQQQLSPQQLSSFLVPPEAQHSTMVDKFRDEFRKKKSTEEIEEKHEGEMIEVVGGPGDNTFTPFDPQMPVGAYTQLLGVVYQLRKADGKKRLEYDQVQTEHLYKSLGKAPPQEPSKILLP